MKNNIIFERDSCFFDRRGFLKNINYTTSIFTSPILVHVFLHQTSKRRDFSSGYSGRDGTANVREIINFYFP